MGLIQYFFSGNYRQHMLGVKLLVETQGMESILHCRIF